jgi:CMP-N-acetylneuraminic acid synthetase
MGCRPEGRKHLITLAVIPARGGSQELKRKNLLPNDDGTPLFLATSAIP